MKIVGICAHAPDVLLVEGIHISCLTQAGALRDALNNPVSGERSLRSWRLISDLYELRGATYGAPDAP